MSYNGWTNYETWNVSLWLDNERSTYVEELAEATCPGVLSGASFVADTFGAAMSEVNWDEIARNTLDELLSEVSS